MEFLLFDAAVCSIIYYILAVLLTDASWLTHLYWPVSSLVFFLISLLLHIDTKRKAVHKKHLPLKLRTFITTTCVLYLSLIAAFGAAMIVCAFRAEEKTADYIILIENSNVDDELTMEDTDALNYAVSYLDKHPDCKVVLSGSSRFSGMDVEVNEEQVQNRMEAYLSENGISAERIVSEQVSDSIRRNIIYAMAYVFVDWYGGPEDTDEDPVVCLIAGDASVLRYKFILKCIGQNVGVLSYREGLLAWPVRIMEEMQLTLRFHLENQFIFKMGGNYGKIQF